MLIVLAFLAAVGWLLLQLLQQSGRVLLRLDALEAILLDSGSQRHRHIRSSEPANRGLPVGAVAPDFHMKNLLGINVTRADILALGRPLLLIFSHPSCGPCLDLMPEIAEWQQKYNDDVTIIIISAGSAELNLTKCLEHQFKHVLLQLDQEVTQAYHSHGTPSAVLISPNGVISSQLAAGGDEIRSLIAKALNDLAIYEPAERSAPAPFL